MSLIARGLEFAGFPTALVSVMAPLSSIARPPRMAPLSSIARPPRQLIRRLNMGATVGRPKDVEGQKQTLGRMVALIEQAEAFGAVDEDAKKVQAPEA